MEMQFDRISVPYLQKLAGQRRAQEQTLEVRLPDGMPDIGHVLGAWGQVIVRSKEWNSGHMAVSCGVMAWVLYMPEDGEEVQSVEVWLPFSMKWELPDTQYDGKILTTCLLKTVDARSTSARKLMVRATVEAVGEGWQMGEVQTAAPGQLPADVEMLTATYPVLLPREAGEKAFLLEEQLSLPAGGQKPERILYYTLQPEIADKKIMAGKVVFRGSGQLHMLCRGADGRVFPVDYELPFSQYGDLEEAYDQDPAVSVYPCVTSLDVSMDENGELQLKAGLLGQYLLFDHAVITVAEDAYSPRREVSAAYEQLQLPAVLDQITQNIQGEKSVQADAQHLVDVTFCPQFGELAQTETGVALTLPGQFQMLYYDLEGQLCSLTAPWEESWNLPASQDCVVDARILPAGKPQATAGAGTVSLRAGVKVDAVTVAGQGIHMITQLELGELEKPQPNRPSLILCRKGSRRLWDVAKETGSTVEAIKAANHLQGEPEPGAVLLIPIS